MITLDVLSVDGDTGLASATYPVYEPEVVYGYANPADTGQTILYYLDKTHGYVLLLVDDTVANVVTALTGGNIDQHLEVTFKEIEDKAFAHDGLINLQNIIFMLDESSDARITMWSRAWQGTKVFVTDDTSSTIAGGGGAYVEFENHVVLKKNDIDTDPVTVYFNQLYVRKRAIGYGYQSARQATALALMELESVAGNAAGTGYTALDVLTVSGGTGTAATIRVDTVGGGGDITGFTVLTTGSYSVLPGATVSVTGGTGSGATFDVDYEVESIAVSDGGQGYRSGTATITGGGGTGATATVTAANGIVTGLTVTAAGNNFTSIPTVTISAPNAGDAIFVGYPEGAPQVWTY